MKGTYDSALTTKHAIAPTLDIRTPAIDGPRMRERLNWVELSARPAPIWSRLTNDGIESASVTPTTIDRTMIIHGLTVPVMSRTTMAVGQSIWIDWNSAITRRRSERSASAPPASVSSHTGAFIANESRPIRNEDAPSVSSSHGSATCWAQVPMLESRLANQKVPNRRVARRLSDSRKVLIMRRESYATAAGTRHLMITTLMASFTIRHETAAYARIASVCDQGRGMSPGTPTRVRIVPTSTSAASATMRALPGIVDQNARR